LPKNESEISFQEKENSIKKQMKELEKLQKWKSSSLTEEDLTKLISGGIPMEYRRDCWLTLSGANHMYKKRKTNRLYSTYLSEEILIQYSAQIEANISRTFRNHFLFQQKDGIGQKILLNILKAYCVHDPSVAYCQGMSGIVGFLMINIFSGNNEDEELLFWFLVRLMSTEKYSLQELFLSGFAKLKRNIRIFDKLLKENQPSLSRHLGVLGVSSTSYAFKWFLMIFVEVLPFEYCVVVWDLFLQYGYGIVWSIALSLMETHSKFIMKSKAMEEVLDILKKFEGLTSPTNFAKQIMKHKINKEKIKELADHFEQFD